MYILMVRLSVKKDKVDEFIKLDEIKKCLSLLKGIKDKSS